MKKLGVNIDHVATLRNARGITDPSPIAAALLAERAGADNITCHLREDRRHIRDQDVIQLREVIQTPLNLEMAVTEEMIYFAIEHQPDIVTFVPEKRQERTTEGGLDVFLHAEKIERAVAMLITLGIEVSLFIEPDIRMIEKALSLGVHSVELHSGAYAENFGGPKEDFEFSRIANASRAAHEMEMEVHVGHGLNRKNIPMISSIPEISSLQIGHSLIGDAVFVGLEQAIAQTKRLMNPS